LGANSRFTVEIALPGRVFNEKYSENDVVEVTIPRAPSQIIAPFLGVFFVFA